MKNKLTFFILSIVFVLLIGNCFQVLACSCVQFSTCGMYEEADAIFVGKVTDSTDKYTTEQRVYNGSEITDEFVKITYASGTISFDVEEVFKGVGRTTSIKLVDETSTCEFRFKPDETYLIYAFKRNDGKYSTTICTPTKLYSAAKEDLEFLKNPPKPGSGAKIFGKVFESVNDHFEENLSYKPFEKVEVQIQSTTDAKKIYKATTNPEGNYEINVAPGKYKINPVIPKYFSSKSMNYRDSEIFVAKDQKCLERSFHIENDSAISGKVLDANGKPVPDITVKLFRENTVQSNIAHGEWATSDEQGKFSFPNISLGRYFLAINFDDAPEDKLPYPSIYYPNVREQNQAQIFEINNGTKHTKVIFLLPQKLKKLKVEGQVTFKDGRPASNVDMKLYDEQFDSTDHFNEVKTDDSGKFVLSGFEGRKYTVRATIWKKVSDVSSFGAAQGESEVFVLDTNTPQIKIVLEEVPEFDLPDDPNGEFLVVEDNFQH